MRMHHWTTGLYLRVKGKNILNTKLINYYVYTFYTEALIGVSTFIMFLELIRFHLQL